MVVLSSETHEKLDLFLEDCVDTVNRLRLVIYSRYGPLPPPTSVDDFIHDALLAVCLGKREWPEHIDAFTLLSGIIRSQISHVRQKNRRMRSTDIGPDITPRARQDSRYLTRREDMQEQPDFHEICDKMRELVADDPVLVRIVELWIKDSSLKPSDIAKALKISMTEMRNAQKRLRRRLSALH